MKANGRRAWRKWAKRRLVKMNAHHRALYTGAKMRKKRDAIDVPPLPSRPFTPRALVGMSQSARKRAARAALVAFWCAINKTDREWLAWQSMRRSEEYAQDRKAYRIGQRLRPCPGKHGCRNCTRTCGACEDQCPDDTRCPRCGSVMTTEGPFCDGSGVLPAGAGR